MIYKKKEKSIAYKEFYIISRYFTRVTKPQSDIEIGIGDDCALLNIPKEKTLAISTDTLVCGHHFLPKINPSDLAYKALAVNISDLAAMGADPAWLLLALTLPEIDETWLKIFSDTLFEQLDYYDMQLISGDTTAGPLSITPVIFGFIPRKHAIKRSGAKPGDWIYVTGTLGDSAAGLAILQNQLRIQDTNDAAYFINRHLRPTPRILHGRVLRNYATSAIDLSDGLISDLQHVLKSSNVGARVDLDYLPLSETMKKHINLEQALCWALSGGEDYELFFTVSERHRNLLNNTLSHFDIPFTCIGQILSESEGLQFIKDGVLIELDWKGYDHFS